MCIDNIYIVIIRTCIYTYVYTYAKRKKNNIWNTHSRWPQRQGRWPQCEVVVECQTSIHEVVGSSSTRMSTFSNLNNYNSPCARAYGVFSPSHKKPTHNEGKNNSLVNPSGAWLKILWLTRRAFLLNALFNGAWMPAKHVVMCCTSWSYWW